MNGQILDALHQSDINTKTGSSFQGLGLTSAELLSLSQCEEVERQEAIEKALKTHRMTLEAEDVDLAVNNNLLGLFEQMRQSFKNLRDTYFGLATAINFLDKDACKIP
jgi:hypothetical protein